MIEITINQEGWHVDQWCVSPIVYLDHWAWCDISESQPLADRFLIALKSLRGTLAFSWLNFIEFSKVTDKQQARKASVLLGKILPQAFILDPNFRKVIDREDQIYAGGAVAPHADLDILKTPVVLKFLANHILPKPNSLKLLPAQNLFSLTQRSEFASLFDSFADLVVNEVKLFRQDYENDPEFRSRVRRLPKGRPNQHGTRFIASELLGSFLKDKKIKVSRRHAIDVSHAVVAVAYCDYVLLDGHWATQVERTRKRITDGGLSFPMAKVFSGKANGVERFLQELESYSACAVS